MSEWDDGYQQGWNDRREFEEKILDAINNPQMSDVQKKILMELKNEFINEEETR